MIKPDTVSKFKKFVFKKEEQEVEYTFWSEDDSYESFNINSVDGLLDTVEEYNDDDISSITVSLILDEEDGERVCGICWPSPVLLTLPTPTFLVAGEDGEEYSVYLFKKPVKTSKLRKVMRAYEKNLGELCEIPLPGFKNVKAKVTKNKPRYTFKELFQFVDHSRELDISFGTRAATRPGDWETATVSTSQFIEQLTDHEEGNKDGLCFLQGDVAGGMRLAKSVVKNVCIVYDLDTGETGDELDERLEPYGYEYVRYTTHSHLVDQSEIKRDMFFKWLGEDATGAVKEEDVKNYLIEVKGYKERILSTVNILDDAHASGDGVKIIVQHEPIDKHRVVFFLDEPFVFQGAYDQKERIKEWRELYHGFGSAMGFTYDQKTTDPSRLFYFPRHEEDGEFEIYHNIGSYVRLEDYPRLVMAKHDTKAVERGNDPKRYRVGTKNLVTWAAKKADFFEIQEALEEHAPGDIFREERTNGYGTHIECPFEHEHTKTGGKGFYIVNASENEDEGGFVAHCLHDSCAGRDRLDHLKGMVENEWLPEDVLTKLKYYEGLYDEDDETVQEIIEEQEDEDEDGFYGIDGFKIEEYRDCYDDPLVRQEMKIIASKYAMFTQKETKFLLDRGTEFFPDTISKNAFLDRLANRTVPIQVSDEKVVREKAGKLFIECPYRKDYNMVRFDPGLPPHDKIYNLFNGFHTKPNPHASWDKLRAHLLDNICSGDEDHFNWLMTWMAQIIQHPGRKMGSCVVLRGEKGTGKSTVGNYFSQVLGKYGIVVNNPKHLTGNFNAHLQGALFVLCEEAVWAGDKQENSALKTLITDGVLMHEKKGVDAEMISNFCRVMMVSNEGWVVPADFPEGERRFFVLDVSNNHQKDTQYFAAIAKQMEEEGGLAAMMYELMHWIPPHPDGWNWLRNPPATEGLKRQAIQTVPETERFFLDFVANGTLEALNDFMAVEITLNEDEETIVPKACLRSHFKTEMARSVQGSSRSKAFNSRTFWRLCRELLLVEHDIRKRRSFRDTPYEHTSAVLNDVGSKNHGSAQAIIIPPRREIIETLNSRFGVDLEKLYSE